jgi:S1-C subfamily serine protease
LKPGTYELSERQSGAMHVQIPRDSSQPVQFNPRPFNAVRLFTPPHSPNGRDIGLKAGDIVTLIDSASITTVEEFNQALADSLERASTTWVVQRGGTPVTVTFDPKLFAKARLQSEPARVE